MQLRPGEQFTVVRQLFDPFDSGTYYVEAKIRDARTDALLATLRLENKGSQRFTKPWVVAPDSAGLGRYIDIETMVYTDDQYTVVSENYRRENAVYLVQERITPPFNTGGGGDISYEGLGKLISERLKEGKSKGIDIKPLLKMMQDVKKAVTSIKVPKYDESAVLDAVQDVQEGLEKAINGGIQDVKSDIANIEKPEPVDLSSIEEKIDDLKMAGVIAAAEELVKKAQDVVGSDIVEMNKNFAELVKAIKNLSFVASVPTILKADLNMPEQEGEDNESEEKAPTRQRFVKGLKPTNEKK